MMRETLMTAANEAYADHFQAEQDRSDEPRGFDGWLVAVRAMVLLVVGMLAISLVTTI